MANVLRVTSSSVTIDGRKDPTYIWRPNEIFATRGLDSLPALFRHTTASKATPKHHRPPSNERQIARPDAIYSAAHSSGYNHEILHFSSDRIIFYTDASRPALAAFSTRGTQTEGAISALANQPPSGGNVSPEKSTHLRQQLLDSFSQ